MISIFTHVMLRDTHSEPGLPVIAAAEHFPLQLQNSRAGDLPRKKNSCRGSGREKKFLHACQKKSNPHHFNFQ